MRFSASRDDRAQPRREFRRVPVYQDRRQLSPIGIGNPDDDSGGVEDRRGAFQQRRQRRACRRRARDRCRASRRPPMFTAGRRGPAAGQRRPAGLEVRAGAPDGIVEIAEQAPRDGRSLGRADRRSLVRRPRPPAPEAAVRGRVTPAAPASAMHLRLPDRGTAASRATCSEDAARAMASPARFVSSIPSAKTMSDAASAAGWRVKSRARRSISRNPAARRRRLIERRYSRQPR